MVARTVAVRALSGKLYEVDCAAGWFVVDLRRAVAAQMSLPVTQVELIRDGDILKDGMPTDDLLGCDLNVVVRQPVLAVSGAHDATVRVWDLDAGACLGVLRGHGDVVLTLAVDFERRRALSGSADNSVCLWDLEAMALLGALKGHSDAVLAVAADFGLGLAASGSIDGTLRLWDLASLSNTAALTEQRDTSVSGLLNDTVTALAADFRQLRAVTGTQDGRLVLWDLRSREAGAFGHGHRGAITRLAAHFAAARAVTSSVDGTLGIWSLQDQKVSCTATLSMHERRILDLAADVEQGFAISCSASSLCCWDLQALRCLTKRKGNFADIQQHPVAEDFDTFEQSSVWDYEAELCDTVNRHACDITVVGANLHRNVAVTGHIDGSLRFLDMRTWRFLRSVSGHTASVRALCVDQFLDA